MDKKEMDKLRSSILHNGEALYVIYSGKAGNFPKGVPIPVRGGSTCRSGFPYPQPKYEECDYYVVDTDGDRYCVARHRYGALEEGFSWVRGVTNEEM